jgi:hypothetical protein
VTDFTPLVTSQAKPLAASPVTVALQLVVGAYWTKATLPGPLLLITFTPTRRFLPTVRKVMAETHIACVGAGTCTAATNGINQAQALLASASFDGTGEYWKSGKNSAANRTTALLLAGILDQYNNGKLC